MSSAQAAWSPGEPWTNVCLTLSITLWSTIDQDSLGSGLYIKYISARFDACGALSQFRCVCSRGFANDIWSWASCFNRSSSPCLILSSVWCGWHAYLSHLFTYSSFMYTALIHDQPTWLWRVNQALALSHEPARCHLIMKYSVRSLLAEQVQ